MKKLHIGELIRQRRKQLEYTLRDIKKLTGLSEGFLSQVERDLTTPSLSSLATISNALDVDIDYFLATPHNNSLVTSAGSRRFFSIENSAVSHCKINRDFPWAQLHGIITRIPKGFVSETISHPGEEIIYIIEGECQFLVGEESFHLQPGDTLHLSSTQPHRWSNCGEQELVFLSVNSMPLFTKKNVSKTINKEDRT